MGSGTDESANAGSNLIGFADGYFNSVSGITSESDSGNPCGPPPCNNFYTLQVNSNTYPASSSCPGYSGYNGQRTGFSCWEQFVFQANGGGNGVVFIEYVLVGYYKTYLTCPSVAPPNSLAWNHPSSDKSGSCYSSTTPQVATPPEAISNLIHLSLSGSSAFVGSNNDEVVFCDSTQCYSESNSDTVLNLQQKWQITEFNVFGYGGGSEALFSGTASTLSINVGEFEETGSANLINPTCLPTGYTGETNNLGLVPNTCTVNQANDKMSFSEAAYYLTMQTSGCCGSVTPSSGYYGYGSSVSIKATANFGYAFTGWTGSGTISYTGGNNPASITTNSPITETAGFTRCCQPSG